jgi:hypothetical protein
MDGYLFWRLWQRRTDPMPVIHVLISDVGTPLETELVHDQIF